ncbi:cilia- and flagella-associated protein 47-like [Agrilus planipennis]|uniref:Cilia- and flagella-associated protein 47-like n=1 Tax=Agrilus planipennis TaxID=224129 RepID=A0A1W4X8T2_AGRPL|nr:cilia- and flagella-associated protein 47-like [Agrilus planipennis]
MERYSQQFFTSMNAGELMLFVEKKRISLQNRDSVEYDDVKITPAFIEFVDPREGQSYEAVITIINRGTRTAFIRIEHPMSFVFTIKPIVRGQKLSPGLTIKRIVTYNYTKASISPYAEIPIYINDHLFLYPLFNIMSEIQIEAIPNEINFGNINAQRLSHTETFLVRNLSGKAVRFVVDIYRSQCILTVEPTRGVLAPKETARFSVQMMSEEPGEHTTQFWIKCRKPIIVKVNACVLQPHFKILHPPPISDNTLLLDFGKTYFGVSISRSLVIRNHSVCKTMYCTFIEYEKSETMVSQEDYYEAGIFKCSTAHGRFHPLEDKAITISFNPSNPQCRKGLLRTKCYFSLFKCTRVNFQDIVGSSMKDIDAATKDSYEHRTSISHAQSQSSLLSSVADDDSVRSVEKTRSIYDQIENSILIFLYAEAFTAAVDLVPSEIHIDSISLMEATTRVINIRNTNRYIPIYFEYRKTAFVELNPSKGKIEALGHCDVLVKIIAAEPGKIKRKITFDLLYPHLHVTDGKGMETVGQAEAYILFEPSFVVKKPIPKINHGITPVITHETGFLPEEVAFNTTISLPPIAMGRRIKDEDKNSNIIAFPNDRPNSLRPRRNLTKRCTTIFAKLPRNMTNWDVYDLSDKLKEDRANAKTYINMYVKKRRDSFVEKQQLAIKMEKEKRGPDYELTDKNRLLMKNMPKEQNPNVTLIEPHYNSPYSSMLPLSPKHLHNIKVHPSKIFLKHIFVSSSVFETVTVQNLNNFSLWIYLRTSKNCLTVVNKSRKCVRANSTEDFELEFTAPSKAKQVFVTMEVIANDCHFSEIDFAAQVVDMMVLLDQTELMFENSECYKIVTLKNLVYAKCSFYWKLNGNHFRIVPMTGTIPPLGILKCAVYRKQCDDRYHDTEAQLNFTSSSLYRTISLNVTYTPFNVVLLRSSLTVSDLPLNIPEKRTVVLRNLDSRCLSFTVVGQEGIPGLTVSPNSGILKCKQDQNISIFFHFKTICELNCKLHVIVGHQTELHLNINVSVVYPNYQIAPSVINFKKIACFSTARASFTIENKCSCRTHFQFPLIDYPTYNVKESDDYTADIVPRSGIYIEPGEKKKFYLFFTPVEVRTVKFYLPLIVNGILGPTSMNTAESKNVSHFSQKYNELYLSISKFQLPTSGLRTLSTMTIMSVVTNAILKLSKFAFHFENTPTGHPQSAMKDILTITNVGDTENEFCIRTDDTKDNISIVYTGKDCPFEAYENSISVVLDVGQEISLDVVCINESKESEKVYAPIFVRQYEKGPLYRYISFEYIYQSPTITSADEIVFFPPVPPYCGIEKTIYLQLSHHVMAECYITTETDVDPLIVTVGDRKKLSDIEETVPVTLFIYFNSHLVVDTAINIKCSCGASLKIGIKGCAENSLVTNSPFMAVYVDPGDAKKPRDEYIIDNQDSCCNLNIDEYCVFFGTRLNIQDYCYPLFPLASPDNKYYEHMQHILSILEKVIYVQGLKERKYIKIPDDFTSMPPKLRANDPRKEVSINLYLEVVLMNIFGKQIVTLWCGKRTLPENDPERLIYIYETYSTIISYVKSVGGTCPHVCAEYLFSYDDYLTFINEIVPQDRETYRLELKRPYNEQTFYRRSKQCWIDLLLQTFKVISLFQINAMPLSPESVAVTSDADVITYFEEEISSSDRSISTDDDVVSQESSNFVEKLDEISVIPLTVSEDAENEFLSTHELVILFWLETNYNTQIKKVWKTQKDGSLLRERQLKNFDYDLRDCLVLLATISYYCPFLDDRIEEVAFDVKSAENRHHNAIILRQWLRVINVDVSVTPEEISLTTPSIYMLLLSSYLFQFLPNLFPRKTIYMAANINRSTTKAVTVRNNDKEAIMYTISFFNNTSNCFTANSDKIRVAGKASHQIKFTFQANTINTMKVYAVLNGENKGYRYAKCMVYVLHGLTKFDQCTKTVKLTVPIYKSVSVNLPIHSPFVTEAIYKVNYGIGKTKSSEEVHLLSWMSTELIPVLPSRIISEKDEVKCNSKGIGNLGLRVFCLSENIRIYILFFTNPEIGDFCIELRISPDTSEMIPLPVCVDIKKEILLRKINEKCICGMTSVIKRSSSCISLRHFCPKYMKISIPCQNSQLWIGVGNIFRSTITGLKDWSENFGKILFRTWQSSQQKLLLNVHYP